MLSIAYIISLCSILFNVKIRAKLHIYDLPVEGKKKKKRSRYKEILQFTFSYTLPVLYTIKGRFISFYKDA